MTRSEHMRWCKKRALAYLPDNPKEACASMLSDIGKHPETALHQSISFMLMLSMDAQDSDEKAREFIEGFNE